MDRCQARSLDALGSARKVPTTPPPLVDSVFPRSSVDTSPKSTSIAPTVPRQRFLCCHSSSFVHAAVVGVLPVEAASASCLEWSPVTLWWACVSARGAYQKLPLIALLRWFHFALKRGACCCLLGKRGAGHGDCTIHFLLCQLYSISITVIRSPLSPSWVAKIPSFTCKKIHVAASIHSPYMWGPA